MTDTNTGADAQNDGNGSTTFATVEEALKALTDTKAELEKATKHLEQSRKEEKFSKSEAKRLQSEIEKLSKNEALAELQGKYEAEVAARSALETKIRNRVVDAALEGALKEAKAKSVSTVLKLVNRDEIKVDGDEVDTKSIDAIIEKLRKEDPVLFEEVETPSVKRAAEGAVVGGYEKEIRAAKSQKQIEEIMRRYGKM